MSYDLAVIGSGIVGLAHAVAARRRKLKVVIIDREARPIGASIRNFGFVTVTGQRRGDTWGRAKRSAEVWTEIAPLAGVDIVHRGLLVLGRRKEAADILEAFVQTEMGERCELLSAPQAKLRFSEIEPQTLSAALFSPHDLRVESRDAIPRLVAWLENGGVDFRFGTAALNVAPPYIETSRGQMRAEAAIVCPGDDLATLYPDLIAERGVTRCLLQMLRLEPPAFRLQSAVMSDLSLVRYRGYADLPESTPLLVRLRREQADHLEHGVHLIVVQSADGSLVVGDSHHYDASPAPFAATAVERLILSEMRATLGFETDVREHWTGTYASAAEDMFRAAPAQNVRLVMVTSGTGASTAFAIGEETLSDLLGSTSERPLA